MTQTKIDNAIQILNLLLEVDPDTPVESLYEEIGEALNLLSSEEEKTPEQRVDDLLVNLTDRVKKQTDWLSQRTKQLNKIPKDEMVRYVAFLERAMNDLVHTDDEELFGAVCNAYYGDVDQDAINLFESYSNFKEE